MRHDGCADDADRDRQRRCVRNNGDYGAEQGVAPCDWNDEHLDQVAKPDHRHERADDQLGGAEAATIEHQQAVGRHGGDRHAGQQRNVEKE